MKQLNFHQKINNLLLIKSNQKQMHREVRAILLFLILNITELNTATVQPGVSESVNMICYIKAE